MVLILMSMARRILYISKKSRLLHFKACESQDSINAFYSKAFFTTACNISTPLIHLSTINGAKIDILYKTHLPLPLFSVYCSLYQLLKMHTIHNTPPQSPLYQPFKMLDILPKQFRRLMIQRIVRVRFIKQKD